jgi:hypothetical protein
MTILMDEYTLIVSCDMKASESCLTAKEAREVTDSSRPKCVSKLKDAGWLFHKSNKNTCPECVKITDGDPDPTTYRIYRRKGSSGEFVFWKDVIGGKGSARRLLQSLYWSNRDQFESRADLSIKMIGKIL